ncbi:MAG TPA: MFS transporter [Solirubrobacteraceae bacterium]|nr:MFS transporter [Solirubrobacteraceae bacterium]
MRARTATTVVFFATGAVFASWAARTPAIQDKLDLSAGELAIAILGIEGGAVLGLPLGGALATRLGSRWTLRIGFVLYPAGMVAVGAAPSLAALTAALALTTAATSLNDVAMNVQGVELERRARRPVMSRLHAGHSFGVLAGALIGTAAAAAGVSVATHFTGVAAAGLIGGLLATLWLVDEPREAGTPLVARPSGALAGLAAIAFCCFLIEGAAIQWSAVHLRGEGAGEGVAAAAFATFALAVAAGRLAGDRIVDRLGRARTVRAAGLVAAAGFTLAIVAPSPGPALVAWAVTGAGVALVAPTVLGAAPLIGDLRPPVAIAAVTTVGYLGSFTGPPAIGALAELTSLPAALAVGVAAAAAIALLAPASLRRA